MERDDGGVKTHTTYWYALSLTSQFYFCGIPFRLDTTPKCKLNCIYCFAMSRGGRRTTTTLIADFDKIRKKMSSALEKDIDSRDITAELLAEKVPIHFGGISDPFSDNDASKLSKKLLGLLGRYHYPVIISTKNTRELLKESTLNILKKIKYLAVQVSITTPDRKLSGKIEPNVPSPAERVTCIENLASEGIYCICRLQPLLFTEINNIVQDLIPMLSEAKCKHVIVEYLKLPVERRTSLFDPMLKATAWEAYDFYKKSGAPLVGREWLLPKELKWENLQPIINSIHQGGMTYGAGDYGLHHLGDTDCCCGIDRVKGFSNWFRGNFANVIKNSKPGYVKFSEVEKYWFPKKSIRRVVNSNCRLKEKEHGILDYLRSKWNAPGTANAPDAFLGVIWNDNYDERGDCVYLKKSVTT